MGLGFSRGSRLRFVYRLGGDWVVTGLYLWWKMPHTRNWGWVALGAGFLSFIGIYIAL